MQDHFSPTARPSRKQLLAPVLALLLCLTGATSIAVLAQGRPQTSGASVSLVSSLPRETRFEVRFSPPERGEGSGSDGTGTLRWPGLHTPARPGEAAVPARIVRVALPPTSGPRPDLELQVEVTDLDRRSGIVFPPAAGAPAKELRGPGPWAEILRTGVERGLHVALVAVYPVQWDPNTRSAVTAGRVSISVTVRNPLPQRTRVAERPDPVGERFWSQSLVNPEMVAAFRTAAPDTAPPAPTFGIPPEWYDDGGGWVKIHIEENGIYALTRDDLIAAGVPVTFIDPRSFRMYAGPLVPEVAWAALGWDAGPPVTAGWDHVYERPGFTGGFADSGAMGQLAISVLGESDGSFDTQDRIVFYALGPDNYRDRFGLPLDTAEDFLANPYTDHTVYWLTWEGTFTEGPLRMTTQDATSPGGLTLNGSQARVHAERNRLYASSLYRAGLRWDEWFWEIMDSGSAGYQFFVDTPHLLPGTDIDAHLRMWGASPPVEVGSGTGDDALHHVQVDVNGVSQGVFQWGGDDYDLALTPQDVFVTGVSAAEPDTFIFRLPQIPSPNPRTDRVYLAWIDVEYTRSLDLDGAAGELALNAGSGGRNVRLERVPSAGSLVVLDVTDFRNPVQLTNVSTLISGSDRAVEFGFPSPERGWVAVSSDTEFKTPVVVMLDRGPRLTPQDSAVHWLRDTGEPMDYVIITDDALVDEAEVLAEWRRDHLYPFTPGRSANVRVVRASDIMDEFAWGMWDPVAIRHYLEYAFLYYGGDPLAYCLFLGDHNYDYRNFSGSGGPGLVPSWEDNRELIDYIFLGNVQYASDDPLARFDGLTDTQTDLFIGRVTVSSAAGARAVLQDKIIRSEETPVYGPWRARCVLAADDLCQRGVPDPADGTRYVDIVEGIDTLLPAVFDRKKLFMVEYGETCDILAKPGARADFIDLWNEGAWLVDYVGHGSESFFSDEQLLRQNDVQLLQNADRLPVLVATASKTGKYNRPGNPGITQSLVDLPGGGALAAYGSASNQTFDDPAYALNLGFINLLFPSSGFAAPAPVGMALIGAKGAIPEDAAKYTLFGDPAVLPPVPALSVTVSGPDSLIRGQMARVASRVSGSGNRSGTLELLAEDARIFRPVDGTGFLKPGERLFEGPAPVVADSAVSGFVVPVSAAGGADARIRAYAWGADWDALGSRDPLVLTGTADPNADTEGPAITFTPHPDRVAPGDVLTAAFADTSGVLLGESGGGIELTVRDGSTLVYQTDVTDAFAYVSGSYTRGTLSFPVPDLTEGFYSFELSAKDTYDNPGMGSTTLEISSSSGDAGFARVFAYPNPMNTETDIVFTLDREAEVTLRIYSVSGRLVLKESIPATAGTNGYRWDGRDRGGDLIANGVYLVLLSAGGSDDAPRHLERVVVLR